MKKHSRFSASGFERIVKCPGSVSLSEGLPDKESAASREGTLAHEVLEGILKDPSIVLLKRNKGEITDEMVEYGRQAANHILKLRGVLPNSDLMIESKVSLSFIHPEAFGTLDAAIVDYFGTLHILDYKFGKSFVSPYENWQFLFYALGVAHQHQWNFSKVRMWTLQPRVTGFDGNYTFWEISIDELKSYIPKFERAIRRAETLTTTYVEGDHCFFCKARNVCPLKAETKLLDAKKAFDKKLSTMEIEENFY
jgi:hypothetical protein